MFDSKMGSLFGSDDFWASSKNFYNNHQKLSYLPLKRLWSCAQDISSSGLSESHSVLAPLESIVAFRRNWSPRSSSDWNQLIFASSRFSARSPGGKHSKSSWTARPCSQGRSFSLMVVRFLSWSMVVGRPRPQLLSLEEGPLLLLSKVRATIGCPWWN